MDIRNQVRDNCNMKYDYEALLSREREFAGEIKPTKIDEFYSDKSRITYCSSFRRLQQKAQVFSLESNASVRTRLTHSLEVSDIGRTIANGIGYKLFELGIIEEKIIPQMVAEVENACLLHDIGNPPFGHFGEAAIQDWANNLDRNKDDIIPQGVDSDSELFKLLMSDFREFDGNPQGFRTIARLHGKKGLNMTYATLLSVLKYVRAAGEPKGPSIRKKAGYFQTEKDLVENLWKTVGINEHCRYPLTYIMEAADDIAYCMSDIEDGIEKHVLTFDDFKRVFKHIWKKKNYPAEELDKLMTTTNRRTGEPQEIFNYKYSVSIQWSRYATDTAIETYIANHDAIYNGTFGELIPEDSFPGRFLDVMKSVSAKLLYPSIQAESIELTGYAVITGIIKHYDRLLRLDYEQFRTLVDGKAAKNLAVERRLFNRLGDRFVDAYRWAVDALEQNDEFAIREWHLRVHLLVDHISGTTDEYALETYQMLEGINLLKY